MPPPLTMYKSNLRTLPMRITEQQFERLHAAREKDGLMVQEHVRRALDIYLAGVVPDFVYTGRLERQPGAGNAGDGLEKKHEGEEGEAPRPRPRIRTK